MKRKDSNGHILKEGESQQPNGTYKYRYTDKSGKRRTIYGKTLNELRAKVEDAKKQQMLGVDIFNKITLGEQVLTCINTRPELKGTSKENYLCWFNSIKNDDVMSMKMIDIKSANLKAWVVQKLREGKSSATVSSYFTGLIRPAFDRAIEDGYLGRNPAAFKLNLPPSEVKKTNYLTEDQLHVLKQFLSFDTRLAENNRNWILFDLETGLRASELCALTVNDVNFDRHEVTVNKQLCSQNGNVWIETLKSNSGYRVVPLTPAAESYLKDEMKDPCRPDISIDGVSGFIFSNRAKEPLDRHQMRGRYKYIMAVIDKNYDTDLSKTSIHSLRHTFCTRLFDKGMDIKSVQYIMGHANAQTTMNVYTHVQIKKVTKRFLEIMTEDELGPIVDQ